MTKTFSHWLAFSVLGSRHTDGFVEREVRPEVASLPAPRGSACESREKDAPLLRSTEKQGSPHYCGSLHWPADCANGHCLSNPPPRPCLPLGVSLKSAQTVTDTFRTVSHVQLLSTVSQTLFRKEQCATRLHDRQLGGHLPVFSSKS